MLTHQPPYKYSDGYTARRDAFNADLKAVQDVQDQHRETVRSIRAIHPEDRTAKDGETLRKARPMLIKAIRDEISLLDGTGPVFVEMEADEQKRAVREAEAAAHKLEADTVAKLVDMGWPDVVDFNRPGAILASAFARQNVNVRAGWAAYENAKEYTADDRFSFTSRSKSLNDELADLTDRQ